MTTWPIWKTIPNSNHELRQAILKLLHEEGVAKTCAAFGIIFGYRASQLWKEVGNDFTLSSDANIPLTRIRLKNVLPSENKISYKDFCLLAEEQGLSLCTPSTGLFARLLYRPQEQLQDSPDLWWTSVAMKPVLKGDETWIFRIAAGTQGARFEAEKLEDSNSVSPKENWLFRVTYQEKNGL